MSTQADFTEQQWADITEAPLQIIMTMFAAGEHGPISAIKESAAGAKVLSEPGNRGVATGLINEIVPAAKSREARKGAEKPEGDSFAAIIDDGVNDLKPAAAALSTLPAEEAQGVGVWLVDIAAAVAGAAKGVSDTERETVAKIAGVFAVPVPPL